MDISIFIVPIIRFITITSFFVLSSAVRLEEAEFCDTD